MQELAQGMKEKVLARLRRNADFPAMANTVSLINKFKEVEDVSITQFANIILRDHALTSKILRLVNSVHYAQFGEVTTISRAIILLGFGNIKNLALTLMLFDHLNKNKENVELTNAVMNAFYSGILAQKISRETKFADSEEAFICAHFHSFGRLMIAFAWPEKLAEVMAFSADKGVPEAEAALAVLGGTYEEFGMTIAKEWRFPAQIVQSMRPMLGTDAEPDPGDVEKLASIATLANELSRIMSSGSTQEEKNAGIGSLLTSFKNHYGTMGDKIKGAIESSKQDLLEYSAAVKIDLQEIPFSRLLLGIDDAVEPAVYADDEAPQLEMMMESLDTLDTIAETGDVAADTPESIFTKGIQDVNNSILSGYSLNDIIRVVLETMYRGMQLSGLSNVLFFIKDTKQQVMNVRFGFGSGIEELKKNFRINFGNSSDLFTEAIIKQKDLIIKSMGSPEIRKGLPEWYLNRMSSDIFLILLPITVKAKPIGIFYIEGEKANFSKITAGQLNYLKVLRDQTVMSIKQKQGF